jgi:hypothetical protein
MVAVTVPNDPAIGTITLAAGDRPPMATAATAIAMAMVTARMTGCEDIATMLGMAQTTSPATLHTETMRDITEIEARTADTPHMPVATAVAIMAAMDRRMDLAAIITMAIDWATEAVIRDTAAIGGSCPIASVMAES